MDPNACLRAIGEEDSTFARELCEDLCGWLRRGGFAPDWAACPAGTRAYQNWLTAREVTYV
jgi:hypothetical protein